MSRVGASGPGGSSGNGGGGTGGSTGTASGPNTGGLPPMGGETLGFPNWFPFPQQNPWDVFLPDGKVTPMDLGEFYEFD